MEAADDDDDDDDILRRLKNLYVDDGDTLPLMLLVVVGLWSLIADLRGRSILPH
jgi:hypothetical protein